MIRICLETVLLCSKRMGPRMLNAKQAGRILAELDARYPDAGTLLHYNNLFELTVAVALSAQTTDEQVNRVSSRLFKQYSTPADLAAADIKILEEIIRPVGLYRNKARHLRAMAQIIDEQYAGRVPDTLEELMSLPGLGRKSANVILAVGFGKPGLGVDTHVQRVTNRLGLVKSRTPLGTEMRLKELLPRELWGRVHHLLIFHGRRVCKARHPLCSECSLAEVCEKNLD